MASLVQPAALERCCSCGKGHECDGGAKLSLVAHAWIDLHMLGSTLEREQSVVDAAATYTGFGQAGTLAGAAVSKLWNLQVGPPAGCSRSSRQYGPTDR